MYIGTYISIQTYWEGFKGYRQLLTGFPSWKLWRNKDVGEYKREFSYFVLYNTILNCQNLFLWELLMKYSHHFKNRQNFKKYNSLLCWEECRDTGLLLSYTASSVWHHFLSGNNPPQLGKATKHLVLSTLPSHR